MTTLLDPRERFLRRTVLLLFFAGTLGATFATLLHFSEIHTEPINLVLPPLMAVSLFGLGLYFHLRPNHMVRAVWGGFIVLLAGICIPVWHTIWLCMNTPGILLVDKLPPLTSALLPLVLSMIVFVRPRHVLVAITVAWLLVALPILVWLALHTVELHSPRGLDMAITLGPVMLTLVIYIPFHRGIEQKVTDLESAHSRMRVLAEVDALTQLANRRAGETRLAEMLADKQGNNALILIDIDRFKRINDTHGHPTGDAVLREVASRCSALLRTDDVFARWGGEEFLVLIKGADLEATVRIAEHLRRGIRMLPIGHVGTVTASFGVTALRGDDTAASALQRIDEALYQAKSSGRDQVVGG